MLNSATESNSVVTEVVFFFSSRRRHTRSDRDWSSDVCSSDLAMGGGSPYFSGARPRIGGDVANLVGLARATGQLGDARVREDIGEVLAMRLIEIGRASCRERV